ncbi:hypothetical protein [Sphingobium fuliginis]|uniref:hypothetical protein n=1 Tax=Sphingobium fuliginis (strain ATCC 27551) TaxID=336203 RepID=UPI0011AFA2E0|nr:hypothetical protein [Sphingobium fuliginis]
MNDSTLPGAAPCVTPKIQRFLERLNRSRVEAVAQAAIDRLDELDGDPDDEESDEDCCSGFDDVGSSVVLHLDLPLRPGDPEDAEREEPHCGNWGINQAEPISDRHPAFG